MSIQEGLKLEPTFNVSMLGMRGVEIPDVGRDDFAKFLYDIGCRVGVEVGIDQGEYGIVLCKVGLKVYGIDSYVRYDAYKAEGAYVSHYDKAVENLKGYDYTIINKFSADALSDFPDNSLDFVYIDGNHTLPYICADIFGWERKVKKGGIISGHDYAIVMGPREKDFPKVYDGIHVKAGVDACAYVMRVPRLYVLGKKDKIEGLKRDKWRSWFFFKQ